MAHTIAQDGIDGHAEGVGYVHKILYAYAEFPDYGSAENLATTAEKLFGSASE